MADNEFAEIIDRIEKLAKPLRWAWVAAAFLLCSGFAVGKGYWDITARLSAEEQCTKEQKTINEKLNETLNSLDKTLQYYKGLQEGKSK